MTGPDPDPGAGDAALAAALQREIALARSVLTGLQAAIQAARSQLRSHTSLVVQANQQLVLAVLQAQRETEDAVAALESASHWAEHDVLTGLPNRALLLHRFAQAAASARRQGQRMALLFVDLNDFKQINDTLGHAMGDAVLLAIGQRLAGCMRDVDTVARIGGDEFAVLVSEIGLPADAGLVAAKLLAAISEPLAVGDQRLRLTASIGIAVHPDDGDSVDRLLAQADAAMYLAKRQPGGAFHFHALPVPAAAGLRPVDPDRRQHALVEQVRQNDLLREANAQLVAAALGAAELRETAEQALARHQTYLALLGHEIRSPLSPLRYAAALLERGPHPPQALARLKQTIERQVVQIARLVDDMLALSQTGQTRLQILPGRVDLVALARQAVEVCQPALDARAQPLLLQADPPVQQATLDATRIVQVLVNLIDNASKYTPRGGGITVTVTGTDHAVSVAVGDGGMGLASPDTRALFEPFLRAPEALASGAAGLGIGLTVVRELVAAHHGTVEVRSDGAGQGAEFTVRLPR